MAERKFTVVFPGAGSGGGSILAEPILRKLGPGVA